MIPPKSLLIVTTSDLDASILDKLPGLCVESSRLCVLWMCDGGEENLRAMLSRKQISFEFVHAAEHLLSAYDDNLFGWFDTVSDQLAGERWWMSTLSEMNFSDTAWFDLMRLDVMINVINAQSPKYVIYLGAGRLIGALRPLLVKNEIQLSVVDDGERLPSATTHLVKGLAKWALNLGSELTAWALTRHRGSRPVFDALVYAGFPANWLRNGDRATYRYTGHLDDKLRERLGEDKVGYLVPIARRSRQRLKSPRTIKRDLADIKKTLPCEKSQIMESFGSLPLLLRCYFNIPWGWWRRWRSLESAGLFRWRGTDIFPLILRHVVEDPLTDQCKNIYQRECTACAFKELGASRFAVPMFELAEARSSIAGAHKTSVRVLGLQHGPNGLAHRWRFDRAIGAMHRSITGAKFKPDLISVEGQAGTDSLTRSGWPADRMFAGGAPRLVVSTPSFQPGKGTRTALVLGEMHDPHITFQVAFEALEQTSWRFVLRPHPATNAIIGDWLAKRVSRLPEQLALSRADRSFEEELTASHPGALIVGVSGATVSSALTGWPIIVGLSNWIPNFNPLLAQDEAELLVANSGMELAEYLNRLANDPQWRAAYSEKCKQAGRKLIEAAGTDAAARMADRLLAQH